MNLKHVDFLGDHSCSSPGYDDSALLDLLAGRALEVHGRAIEAVLAFAAQVIEKSRLEACIDFVSVGLQWAKHERFVFGESEKDPVCSAAARDRRSKHLLGFESARCYVVIIDNMGHYQPIWSQDSYAFFGLASRRTAVGMHTPIHPRGVEDLS